MIQGEKLKKWGYLLLIILSISSCQRSAQFRKDSDSGMDGGDRLYDSQQGNLSMGSPGTQRSELLGQPKKRILVLNFWNNTPITLLDVGSFAANELKRGLFLSQKVLLSDDGKSDLNTVDFVEGEHVRVAQLIREGRRNGVAVLVIGRVTKVIFRQKGDEVGLFRQRQSLAAVDVEMKIFDVLGGREIIASTQSGEASASATVAFENASIESPNYRSELIKIATRQAVAKFVPDVVHSVDKLAWQGRIAKLVGPKIYVNAGRASGLLSGDILKVLNPGDEVYDPVSGALLGRAQGQLKGTLEVVDFIGADAAVAQVHTGANFKEGDFVQLY